MMGRELRTEILIDAAPDRVWEVLTDKEALGEWNPFIKEMDGELREGERLRVILQQPNRKPMTIKPRLMEVSPGRELRWLGHLGVPGLFDGEHIFELHPEGPRSTRFVHREEFGGLFVPMFWRMLDTDTREGFEQMNHALKQRAEAAA
ncbi:MAG: SRPBCC domain-containing protein [Thermoplasmata archaeon]|nr:MAG: SRPBCC domain-containing protein [Thermoplasmata archaeon]